MFTSSSSEKKLLKAQISFLFVQDLDSLRKGPKDQKDPILNFAQEELDRYCTLLSENLTKKKQKERLTQLHIKFEAIPQIKILSKEYQASWTRFQEGNDPDAYYIIANEIDIFIYGNTSRAILFGVYRFLEVLGIRWFFPGRKNEFIPDDLPSTLHKICIIDIPAFNERGLQIDGSAKWLEEWIDFAAKSRLNKIYLTDLSHVAAILPEIRKRGLDLNFRLPVLGHDFCTINKTSFHATENRIFEHLYKLPLKINDIHFTQDEGYIKRCKCPGDKLFHTSDLLLRRLNLLINNPKFTNTHQFGFNAYLGTWRVPERVLPHPQIFLELTPVHRCYTHSIDDPFCKINRKYVKPILEQFLTRFSVKSAHLIDFWLDSTHFARHAFEYFAYTSAPSQGRIPIIPKVLQRDLQFYRTLGLRKITSSALGINGMYVKTYCSPTIYCFAKLAWNPDLPVTDLLRDFCLGYFGSDKINLFFDEHEAIDPKDVNATRFYAYLDLTEKRIHLLRTYLDSLKSAKLKTRVKALIEENQRKLFWKNNFGTVRLKGFIETWWFWFQRWRC
jgi:hypothetical protein